MGLYQSRWFQGYEPKKKDTPMYRIVLNTFVILMISSALPVVSRILGMISNFFCDLRTKEDEETSHLRFQVLSVSI